MTGLDRRYTQAAQTLETHPDFKVLRRITSVDRLYDGPAHGVTRVGLALDVETTGLERDTDRIIELAVQRFRFDALGRIVQIGTPRVWREDPRSPLDPRITLLTGLTDEDLAGQTIDEPAALEILGSADFIVAHNAAFDRPFVSAVSRRSRGGPGPVRWRSWIGSNLASMVGASRT